MHHSQRVDICVLILYHDIAATYTTPALLREVAPPSPERPAVTAPEADSPVVVVPPAAAPAAADEDADEATWRARRQAAAQGKQRRYSGEEVPPSDEAIPLAPPAENLSMMHMLERMPASTPVQAPPAGPLTVDLTELSEDEQLARAIALSMEETVQRPRSITPPPSPSSPAKPLHAPVTVPAPSAPPSPPPAASAAPAAAPREEDDAELRKFLAVLNSSDLDVAAAQADLAEERKALQQQHKRDQRDAATVTAEMVADTQVR